MKCESGMYSRLGMVCGVRSDETGMNPSLLLALKKSFRRQRCETHQNCAEVTGARIIETGRAHLC